MSTPPVTHSELLAPVKRWTWTAKFWLCEGIYRKTVTATETKRVHAISDEELNRWYTLYRQQGAPGLQKINRTHNRRRAA